MPRTQAAPSTAQANFACALALALVEVMRESERYGEWLLSQIAELPTFHNARCLMRIIPRITAAHDAGRSGSQVSRTLFAALRTCKCGQ